MKGNLIMVKEKEKEFFIIVIMTNMKEIGKKVWKNKREYIIIIVAVNNLILFDNSDNIKFILGERNEILNLFLGSGKSISTNIRKYGLKSFLNILMKENIDTNIIFDMVILYMIL